MRNNPIPEAVPTALRNELVLQKIFQFLPMKSLLSLSVVCKIWNQQARTYIRDQRKWTISICPPFACNHLSELDETIGKMTIVPFNSLDFYLEPHENCLSHQQHVRHRSRRPQDRKRDRRFSCENLFARMKLKYMSICLEGELPKCPALVTISRLLLEKGKEIKDLHLGRISFSLAQFFSKINVMELPQLEKLQISALYDDWSKEFVGKILWGNNPRLRKIINNGDNRIFEILPKNKLRFLNSFSLVNFDGEDLNQAMKLAESRPTLSELDVSVPRANGPQTLQCLQIVQSLLQSSSKSIGTLSLTLICFLKATSFPPLENLFSLKISSWGEPEEIRNSLHLIEFGRLFPKLQDVEVSSRGQVELQGARHPEFDNEETLNHGLDTEKTSKTTCVLALKGSVRSFSFLQLQKSFPAVVDLIIMPGMSDAHVVPFRLIFRLWPNLKSLVVTGMAVNPVPNCDAAFCGIYQEEVELLWSMDEEYLRDVHIVPVRPCVSTMSSLSQMAILLSRMYDLNATDIGPGHKFLSSVTKYLVFQRMPWLTLQLNN